MVKTTAGSDVAHTGGHKARHQALATGTPANQRFQTSLFGPAFSDQDTAQHVLQSEKTLGVSR